MDRLYKNGFLLILLSVGLVWLRSSLGKITGGKFISTLPLTLEKFAKNNPNSWYSDFIKNIAIPNSNLFGNLTMLGEFLSATSITLACLYLFFSKKENKNIELIFLIGLIVGSLLNLNFYFAAGWTSSSTESLNLLMFVIQALGVVVFGKKYFKRF